MLLIWCRYQEETKQWCCMRGNLRSEDCAEMKHSPQWGSAQSSSSSSSSHNEHQIPMLGGRGILRKWIGKEEKVDLCLYFTDLLPNSAHCSLHSFSRIRSAKVSLQDLLSLLICYLTLRIVLAPISPESWIIRSGKVSFTRPSTYHHFLQWFLFLLRIPSCKNKKV